MLSIQCHTIGEVAEILTISNDRVKSFITSGELRASKVGKRWKITHVAIEEFLFANQNAPKPGTKRRKSLPNPRY